MRKEDILLVEGMRFWGTHGYFPEENKLGQEFIVDIEALIDMTDMCEQDEFVWEISYVALFKAAKRVVENEEHKLIQRIAYRIIEEVFTDTPASRVKVTVKKPAAPIGGIFNHTGCVIERGREEMQ
ncbi:dihydroneopterin aldolase [Sediminispirochaeta bajacaliforniensis]|uniref:dihydroneopterin aldolase n=1 Tax=Sediminispirochaeta bajacaliforniensis TaxID=148 RepID=UPI0003643199|nr:dihydroneopterin aldolase [Sediminispirochaeta bajacaliforniensis]